MASINASTSGAGGVITTADNTGNLNIQSAGSTVLALTSSGTTITGTESVSGNLSFNSGYGSSAVAYGCRVWVSFNGTGTVAIVGSGNVSSITDNAVGDYTVNFTTAMPDTNYAAIVTAGDGAAGASSLNRYGNVGVYSTTSCKVFTGLPASTALDVSFVNFSVFR